MCRGNVSGRFGTGWQKCVIFIIFLLFGFLKCLKSAFFERSSRLTLSDCVKCA